VCPTRSANLVSSGGQAKAPCKTADFLLRAFRIPAELREGFIAGEDISIMGDIRFEFSVEKLINAIALFFDRGVSDLTKLKIAKLLYFADKKHLLSYGSPILGDVYWCMNLGPVPSFALNEMSEAIDRSEGSAEEDSDYSVMSRVLRVRKRFFSYPHFEAKQPHDPSIFSQTELAVLDSIVAEYGRKSALDLVNLTHKEPTWFIANKDRRPGGRAPIPYELFFEGAPESSRRHLARLKADFSGEAIPLAGDREYSEFAASLIGSQFDSDFDLDSDQLRKREILR